MEDSMDNGMNFWKRDWLLEMEQEVRKWWDECHVFNAEASDQPPKAGGSFLGPSHFHILRGANVLLPFGFHCTGMPIKAAADKLRREIERFGNPPSFPSLETEEIISEPGPSSQLDRFKGKKSKAASKAGKETYQWEIMRGYGLSDAEIATFQDPVQWLRFFPPLAVEDLKAFGLGADWRRSFITTDINPFFDSFVRWQMRNLVLIMIGASGEGVIPQEYTLIKMEVVPPFPAKFAFLEGKKVYLAAATLRPETMYGQTNSWVLLDGKYGGFEINESEVFILTERAARNLAFQRLSRLPEKPSCLVELTGQDLIGLPLRSPLSFNEIIYCLPMLSVITDKGTGIVTSVPSDSPDDFMALQDLKAKASFRAKLGVKDEWVLPFEVIPIISHPEFGNKSAEKICTDMKIKSQNEREKLDDAKR
ncbi:hypothetical protein OROHE_019302 [Orobanche hederae]